MPNPPTKKQLGYLKGLGYVGTPPTSSWQASAAIDSMRDAKDSKAAERAVLKQRQAEEKDAKESRRNQLRSIKDEIAFMVNANRDFGGEGLYAGFILRAGEEPPSEEDAQNVDAFVPLSAARKHPELLLRETLDCDELMVDDRLPRGSKGVVAPGVFGKVVEASQSKGGGCAGAVLLAVGLLGAMCLLA